MLTVRVVLAVAPPLSVTVSVTVYVALTNVSDAALSKVKVCAAGDRTVEVAPLPKLHAYDAIVPSVSAEELVNDTDVGARPEDGERVNAAVGGVLSVIVRLAVAVAAVIPAADPEEEEESELDEALEPIVAIRPPAPAAETPEEPPQRGRPGGLGPVGTIDDPAGGRVQDQGRSPRAAEPAEPGEPNK